MSIPPLETRRWSEGGPSLSSIGMGTWAFGGRTYRYGWGSGDPETSAEVLERALAMGINWVDTAASYGDGRSESIVGSALARLPSDRRPLVFSKCGLLVDPENPFTEPLHCLRPSSVRQELEESLRRLGRDSIDAYFFHRPDETGVPIEDSWGELSRLCDEGKVRYCGLSNFAVELLERAHAVRPVDLIQTSLSLLRPVALKATLPWARRNEVGVLAYSPLESGLLSGAFSRSRADSLPEGDWRLRSKRFRGPALDQALRAARALGTLATRWGTSTSALAMDWVLSRPGVTGVIAGAREPGHVDGWIDAGRGRLSVAQLADIERAVASARGES